MYYCFRDKLAILYSVIVATVSINKKKKKKNNTFLTSASYQQIFFSNINVKSPIRCSFFSKLHKPRVDVPTRRHYLPVGSHDLSM